MSVAVKTGPFNSRSTGRSDSDGSGRGSPAWDEKLVMDLSEGARFITAEVRAGDRMIGAANIPVTDFVGGYLPDNYPRFLSYRLRDSRGERNGIVNLSVKVVGGGCAWDQRDCAAISPPSWLAIPPADIGKLSGGVVMGIPITYT